MRGYCRLVLSAILAYALLAFSSSSTGMAGTSIRDGDWIGWFKLPADSAQVPIDLQLHGDTALVALGPGHAALQSIAVRRSSSTLSFALPGLPAPLTFTFHLQGRLLIGLARQGKATGKARLSSGKPSLARFLGTFRTAGGDLVIINDLRRIGAPPWWNDVGTDRLRGLYRLSPTSYAIGAGVATRNPVTGTIRFAHDGSSLTESFPGTGDVQATRVPFRQLEVRFPSGKVTLAGTLTLPGGSGPFPAVMMAHGSGPSLRDEGQTFSNFLAAHGIASLVPDKQGRGQSGGVYPGEYPGEPTVATYAADTVAGGRFLAKRPEIDTRRIGLFGGSQAGWIIPRAAAESGSLFSFAVILSGPTVSVGENDHYSELTTQGAVKPDLTPQQIEAAVVAQGPSGVDPRPVLRTLRIPIFWVYGGLDQNQPTHLDVLVLQDLKAATGADFSWVVFPEANHGLVITKTGLNSEADASPGFAHGLFSSIATWLQAHSIGN